MKKILLLCVAFAAVVCTTSAQIARNRGLIRMSGNQTEQTMPGIKAMPNGMPVKIMDVKKGSYATREGLDPNNFVQDPKEINMMAWAMGMSLYDVSSEWEGAAPSIIDYATYVPSEIAARFKGNRVIEIPFNITYGTKEITFWIRHDLASEEPDWQYEVNMETANIPTGPTSSSDGEILHYMQPNTFQLVTDELDESFTIDGTPFYAGFTVKYSNLVSKRFLLLGSSSLTGSGAIYNDGEEDWYSFGSSYAIDLPLVTEGDAGLADNDININYYDYVRVEAGSSTTPLNVTFTNMGSQPVSTLTFNYSLNGQVLESNIQVKDSEGNDFFLPYLCNAQLSFEAPVPDAAGRYYSVIQAKAVNGESDGYPQSTPIWGGIVSIDEPFTRVPVMEQMTGVWCGWCPRGHLAVDEMDELYADRYIPIAIHFDYSAQTKDPFTASTYSTLVDMVGGQAPICLINRSVLADPFYGTTSGTPMGITGEIEAMGLSAGEATVGVSSVLSADKKSIDLGAHILFHLPAEGDSYSMAYALLEDNLPGSQANSYAYYYENGMTKAQIEQELPGTSELCDLGNPYRTTFNHIARAIYDCTGIEGSLPGTAVSGETMYHHYTIDVPSTVTDLENCSIVAMLIDNFSGEIVTAAKVKVGECSTGIAAAPADNFNAEVAAANGAIRVSAAAGTASVYTADGKLVGQADVNGQASIAAERGAYIVRVVNGNSVVVKKVVL